MLGSAGIFSILLRVRIVCFSICCPNGVDDYSFYGAG